MNSVWKAIKEQTYSGERVNGIKSVRLGMPTD